jgi:hypothetical protein
LFVGVGTLVITAGFDRVWLLRKKDFLTELFLFSLLEEFS